MASLKLSFLISEMKPLWALQAAPSQMGGPLPPPCGEEATLRGSQVEHCLAYSVGARSQPKGQAGPVQAALQAIVLTCKSHSGASAQSRPRHPVPKKRAPAALRRGPSMAQVLLRPRTASLHDPPSGLSGGVSL